MKTFVWFHVMENFKLHEVKDEHYNCTSYTAVHPRITHPHDASNEDSYYVTVNALHLQSYPRAEWANGRQPALPLADNKTYLKIERKLSHGKYRIVSPTIQTKASSLVQFSSRETHKRGNIRDLTRIRSTLSPLPEYTTQPILLWSRRRRHAKLLLFL